MESFIKFQPPTASRIGFHYYPDSIHYREQDLVTWLPELNALGANSLVLHGEATRAIPEHFLRGLLSAGITPLVEFNLSLAQTPEAADLETIFDCYSRWGVTQIILFDKPNARSSWSSATWAQEDLVERFLDRYIPLARLALQYDLMPIFPPLEPGGNFWDTAFLRTALVSLQRRGEQKILDELVLAAYAWSNDKPLNWGAGGPERNPEVRPYFTPAQSQDQRGFRIYDWYEAIAQAVLQKNVPIILLQAGHPGPQTGKTAKSLPEKHLDQSLAILSLLSGEPTSEPRQKNIVLESVPEHVISCNLWLLTSSPSDPDYALAWYKEDGTTLPVVDAFKEQQAQKRGGKKSVKSVSTSGHPIQHYMLLPSYEWGVSDWHLEIIRPYVKKYRPTIGFSVEEAVLAKHITVIGSEQAFPEELLTELRESGCSVERISGNGTSIATQLAER